ncbi:PREDICTED: auxilin-like protein 1 [Tarenaya hassleriana]|uniref:auxilin-like protein 1 n=1 Tax=Tarenaya hassleriana TaxID=28532 RepID=UPI00053C574F|nr:PREDICTED: auxilin-like protein 1 [Tarenaya hassleriana]
MENLSHSRHPNRSVPSLPNFGYGSGKVATAAYDEVFGGPQRFGAPTLSPRLEDYCEIFGGFNGASRAAVSSIPVLDLPLVDDRDVYFDVRSPGFDYREVFGGFDDLDFAPSYEELFAERSEVGGGDSSDEAWTPEETGSVSAGTEHSSKSPCFSNGRASYESIEGSTEFNISYNKAGQMSYTNLSNGVTHVADPGVISGCTFSVDEMAYAYPTTKLNKKTESFFCGDTSGFAFGNDERIQKHRSTVAAFPSETFMTVSDINLKTQPSEVPPPSRPPPILKRDSSSSASNARTTVSEGSVDDNSPRFFDVELDSSSAALREAIGNAQARLKGAKEILERKRDGSRITLKPSPANESKGEEGKFSHDNMAFPAGSPESEKNINGARKSTEDKHGKKPLPLQGSAKFDGNGEWKEATQFFELVRTEKPRNADESSSGNDIRLHRNAELPEQKQKWAAKGDIEKLKGRETKVDKGKQEVEKSPKNYGTKKVAYGLESHEKEKLAEKDLQEAMEENSRNVLLHIEAENKLLDHGGSEKHKNLVRSEREGNVLVVDKCANKEKELHCEETNNKCTENKELGRIKPHPQKAVERKHEYVFEWEQSARKLREALGLADNESMLAVPLEPKEDGKKPRATNGMDENEKKLKEALERIENENKMKAAREKEENERRVREALEKAESEKRLKAALEQEEKERTLREEREREENERRMKEIEKAKQEKRMKEEEEKERQQKEAFEKEEKNRRMKEARERAEHERKLKLAQEEKERGIKEACEKEESERKLKEARERAELERRQKEALEQEQKERQLKEAMEKAESERRLKEALEQAEKERKLKKEQEEKKLKEAIELEETERKLREDLERAEIDRRLKEALEQDEMKRKQREAEEREESENEEKQHDGTREDIKEKLEEAIERDGNNGSQREDCEREKTCENLGEVTREDEEEDNHETPNEVPAEEDESAQEETRDMSGKACPWKDFEKNLKDASRKEGLEESNTKDGSSERNAELGKGGGDYHLNGENVENTKAAAEEDRVRNMAEDGIGRDHRSRACPDLGITEGKFARQDKKPEKPLPSRVVRDFVDTTIKEALPVKHNTSQTTGNKSRNLDEILMNREREIERIKREREREKDRMGFDQRALADARERLEKACAEAREKSTADKLSAEARLRAERAAVDRATAEARERAAEKAAIEARERMERSVPDNNKQFRSSSSFIGSRYQNAPAYSGADVESPQRYISRLERHRRTADRVAKALEEKNMRDLVAQREQAERNRLAETLDAEVKRWSGGKEGNVRALLSTLQYILGPESGWQPIPLTEVITSAAVKKAYRKATLCVHPDKLQQRGASIQQKYICEKVFDLLKEAWNRFNSEER